MENHDAFENMFQSSCLFCCLFDSYEVVLYYINNSQGFSQDFETISHLRNRFFL